MKTNSAHSDSKKNSILQEFFGGSEPKDPIDGQIWFDENRVMHVAMGGSWWVVVMLDKYYVDSRTLKVLPRSGSMIKKDDGEWISYPEEDKELSGMFTIGDEE